MLKISNLESGYEGTTVLRGVDIFVKPGEIVALIGPNGAGKSTILKSIFNLADISGGRIIYKDKDITGLPTHELICEGISYVPQGRQIFSGMTVLENLEMGAFIFNDKEMIRRNIEDVFAKFPVLKEKRSCDASSLSGGQQQMLTIARALIQNPQLLLLDEPSLGLAPIVMTEVFEKIQSINAEGVSILLVEQNAKQAVSIANRTYVLENGTVGLEGDKKILSEKKVQAIYFGEA